MKILLYNVLTLSSMAVFLVFVSVDSVGSVPTEYQRYDHRETLCAIATGTSGCTEVSPRPTLEDAMGLCNAKPPTTKPGKCLLECNWRYHNITTNNGFQHDYYLYVVKKDHKKTEDAKFAATVKDILTKCTNRKDPKHDKCDAAAAAAECMHNEGKKLNISSTLGYEAFYTGIRH